LKAIENGTDERLLIEAAQRDPARFAELYESNFDRIYAFIARRVRDREEAQDLTAEVFHQALSSLARFDWRGAPFIAWLLGIANNVLSDHWRRRSKQREVATEELEESVAADQTERHAMVFQLVANLLPDQRLVILRRFVCQKSLREIAQEMGRTEGAIKQLQLRALQALRNRMKE
jgi:RNA polymerase sigma-70 factor, ECF subfamily